MDSRYVKLFTQIAQSIEVIAEQAMEANRASNDKKGEDAAEKMREMYMELHDRMSKEDFDPKTLSKADYARILVGAAIAAQGIENRIKTEQKALEGYKIDTIPKLNRIMDEAKDDDSARALAKELFTIKNSEG